MAFTVDIPFRKRLRTPRDLSSTFGYLADWEKAIPSNFPGLESFLKKGSDTYGWAFEEIRYQKFRLRIEFATRMEAKAPDSLGVVPLEGPHRLAARWRLQPEGGGTAVDLQIDIQLELPAPGLLRGILTPLARTEITKLLEKYAVNVEKALSA